MYAGLCDSAMRRIMMYTCKLVNTIAIYVYMIWPCIWTDEMLLFHSRQQREKQPHDGCFVSLIPFI